MMRSANRIFIAIIFCGLFAPVYAGSIELYSKDSFSLDLSGYMQDQAQHTRDFMGNPYDQNQLRARNELSAQMGPNFSGLFSHSFEVTSGACLSSLQYWILKALPSTNYFDWEWTIEDNEQRHVRHSIYRAYVVLENESLRMVAGRQRVAWGTALFWNPTDLFNPVDPISLEPMEKQGVDALSMEMALNQFTYLTVVHALCQDFYDTKTAVRLKSTIKSFDFSVMGGRFLDDEIAGADFLGYVKDGSLYGEGTYTWAEDADDYLRLSLGYQYSWPNTTTLAVEYYHNGGNIEWEGDRDFSIDYDDLWRYFDGGTGLYPYPLSVDLAAFILALIPEELFSDPLATFGRNFLGVSAGYEITPLVRADISMILDIDKRGLFVGPHLLYLATGSLSVEGGAQFFGGDPEGEFSWMHNILWARLKYDFG